jgi:hypothetical protein
MYYRRQFILPGLALTGLEIALVALPTYMLLDLGPEGPALLRITAPVAAIIGTLVWRVLLAMMLAPIDQALERKQRGQPISNQDAEIVLGAIIRTPQRAMWLRAAMWSLGALLVSWTMEARDGLPEGTWETIVTIAGLNAYVAALPRALLYRRILGRVRADLLPNVDAMRIFGTTYRQEILDAAITTGAFGNSRRNRCSRLRLATVFTCFSRWL